MAPPLRIIFLVVLFALLLNTVCAADSQLEIEDLDLLVDGDRVSTVDTEGGTVEAVEPDSQIILRITLENLWPEGTENHDIKHIDLDATLDAFCQDMDDDEQSQDISKLEPGEKEKITFTFNVPLCAQEDNDYDLLLEIEGEDEDGTIYRISRKIEIEILREKAEILFYPPVIYPNNLSCDRTFAVDVFMQNIGREDEEVGLLIINKNLSINEFEWVDLEYGDFGDEGTYYNHTFFFTVSQNVSPGTYSLRLEAEYARKDEVRKQFGDVSILACGSSVEIPVNVTTLPEANETNTTLNQTSTENQTDAGLTNTTVYPVPEPSQEPSLGYIVLLVVMVLVLGMIFIGLLIVVFKKKPKKK